jgi:hypothetical protein
MKILVFIYLFVFVCVFTMSAKQQPHTKDCVKHPQIVKTSTVTIQEKTKAGVTEKVVKSSKNSNSLPHFSVFNFINFFYTKDTLDNIQVM